MLTLWRVYDEATAELVKKFYENLFQKKMGRGEALREAQLAMRGEKLYSHPVYWAGFTLSGKVGPISLK